MIKIAEIFMENFEKGNSCMMSVQPGMAVVRLKSEEPKIELFTDYNFDIREFINDDYDRVIDDE